MAIAHATTYRNGLADYIADAHDVGSTNPEGRFLIYTAAFALLLATLKFASTAFGPASNGICTAAAMTPESNCVAGTAAVFKTTNRDNTEILRGTVTATGGGGDLVLSSVGFAAGDKVEITSLTYEAAA